VGSILIASTTAAVERPRVLIGWGNQNDASITPNDATNVVAVSADGIPPLSYQWNKNGIDLAGETNSNLTILHVQPAYAGEYTVYVRKFGPDNQSTAAQNDRSEARRTIVALFVDIRFRICSGGR